MKFVSLSGHQKIENEILRGGNVKFRKRYKYGDVLAQNFHFFVRRHPNVLSFSLAAGIN